MSYEALVSRLMNWSCFLPRFVKRVEAPSARAKPTSTALLPPDGRGEVCNRVRACEIETQGKRDHTRGSVLPLTPDMKLMCLLNSISRLAWHIKFSSSMRSMTPGIESMRRISASSGR
mgnify:CR=1 FL=1